MAKTLGVTTPTLTGSDSAQGPLAERLYRMKAGLLDEEAAEEVYRDAILPAIERNYHQSGMHVHGGQLIAALAIPHHGTFMTHSPDGQISVRLNPDSVHSEKDGFAYAEAAVFGRDEIDLRGTARTMRFLNLCSGRWVRTKYVKAAPHHEIMKLRIDDIAKIYRILKRRAQNLNGGTR